MSLVVVLFSSLTQRIRRAWGGGGGWPLADLDLGWSPSSATASSRGLLGNEEALESQRKCRFLPKAEERRKRGGLGKVSTYLSTANGTLNGSPSASPMQVYKNSARLDGLSHPVAPYNAEPLGAGASLALGPLRVFRMDCRSLADSARRRREGLRAWLLFPAT